jgi:U5 small nuclear ribonucleoprotein component
MEEDLYDEFGNYLGPSRPAPAPAPAPPPAPSLVAAEVIVLHEDKQYYPAHEEVYPEAQILLEQEDRQPLETPIVPGPPGRGFTLDQQPALLYDPQFLRELAAFPEQVRVLAVCGALHHGKTRLLDQLLTLSHASPDSYLRWCDSRLDEQARGVSLKATAVSLVLPCSRGKSRLFHLLDTPGHPAFAREVTQALRACDGVLLVVDVVEGVLEHARTVMAECVRLDLPMILCLSKLDRLILELRLPPDDCYLKLQATVSDLNLVLHEQLRHEDPAYFNPLEDNVLFSSAEYHMLFTARGFLAERNPGLAPFAWGNHYYQRGKRTVATCSSEHGRDRVFVQFVLLPLYKLVTACLTKERPELEPMLARVNLKLAPYLYKEPGRLIVQKVLREFCFRPALVTDLLLECAPAAAQGNLHKLAHLHPAGQPSGTVVDVVKVVHVQGQQLALGRVLQGELVRG